MAWELELLYGFGDWSFYGFGDWSFYGLPDVWSFYGFSDRRSFQSWLLWICLVTGASVDLMVGASVDLMECWIFSYRFFCPCIGEMKTVAWLDGYWMFRTSWFLGGGV